MGRTLTQEEFLQRCYKKHGDRYDYSQAIYKSAHTFIDVICRKHPTPHTFSLTANSHTNGTGCPKCSGKYRKNTQEFIEESIDIHGCKFDYSQVNYINSKTHVNITCNICNWSFPVAPNNHLGGSGCPKCFMPNIGKTTEEAIDEARAVHGDKYSYEKLVYTGVYKPFIIICSSHGEYTTDYQHFVTREQGCIKCADRVALTKEEFIERARKVHGDRYSYENVLYTCNKDPVEIICSRHGIFLQSPNMHISHANGCPSCKNKTEGRMKEFLTRNFPDIEIIHDKTWTEVYGKRRPDFRIPSMKLILEVDGQQHFEQIANWNPVKQIQLIDIWKTLKALQADYSVIRIHHLFLNKDNWETLLLPHIHEYKIPQIGYTHPYTEHRDLLEQWKNKIDDLERLIDP